MILNKKRKEIDNEIMRDAKQKNNDSDFVINIKADNSSVIFSKFNYDNKDILNSDLADYISKNAKLAGIDDTIILKIYTNKEIQRKEIESAVKAHYKREYIETKTEINHANLAAAISLIFGIFSLAVLVILNSIFDNFYLTQIVEILAWVFVWEAADKFFYVRNGIKRKAKITQNLYISKIEIIKTH